MFFKKSNASAQQSPWLQLLIRVDGLNRRVKEPGWNYEDKQKVYQLKDMVIKRLLMTRPAEVQLQLYYVPYYKYSEATKDKAGRLMRSSMEKLPFEYFLSQIPPCAQDMELPEKALVEVVAACNGFSFSFHMPVAVVRECGIDTASLNRKVWISAHNFHHELLREQECTITQLLAEI